MIMNLQLDIIIANVFMPQINKDLERKKITKNLIPLQITNLVLATITTTIMEIDPHHRIIEPIITTINR